MIEIHYFDSISLLIRVHNNKMLPRFTLTSKRLDTSPDTSIHERIF